MSEDPIRSWLVQSMVPMSGYVSASNVSALGLMLGRCLVATNRRHRGPPRAGKQAREARGPRIYGTRLSSEYERARERIANEASRSDLACLGRPAAHSA